MYRSSRQDADALEEELEEGQVRVQAEEAHRRGLLPRYQGKGRDVDGRQPQLICFGSGQRWSEATKNARHPDDKHVILKRLSYTT